MTAEYPEHFRAEEQFLSSSRLPLTPSCELLGFDYFRLVS